ncbi:hypothetical protein NCT62_003829 [Escherichia coli]|nr:hypothetical protein [Escherichia coli]
MELPAVTVLASKNVNAGAAGAWMVLAAEQQGAVCGCFATGEKMMCPRMLRIAIQKYDDKRADGETNIPMNFKLIAICLLQATLGPICVGG